MRFVRLPVVLLCVAGTLLVAQSPTYAARPWFGWRRHQRTTTYLPSPLGAAPASEPFLPPAAGLDHPDPPPAQPLQPGERPLLIHVTLAPKELVARTSFTWGYNDVAGQFVEGGRGVVDYRGGVAFAAIPPSVNVEAVEIRACVDYVQPQHVDLQYVLRPTVGASGVAAVLPTTSNVQRQRLLLRSLRTIYSGDYLSASFQTRSATGDAMRQHGSTLLRANDLAGARFGLVERIAEFPVRPEDRGPTDWVLHGRLQGRPVELSFAVEDREAIEVFQDAQGRLRVWLGPGAP
jgi:hypothetical protein